VALYSGRIRGQGPGNGPRRRRLQRRQQLPQQQQQHRLRRCPDDLDALDFDLESLANSKPPPKQSPATPAKNPALAASLSPALPEKSAAAVAAVSGGGVGVDGCVRRLTAEHC
jgi:hypothetical protein